MGPLSPRYHGRYELKKADHMEYNYPRQVQADVSHRGKAGSSWLTHGPKNNRESSVEARGEAALERAISEMSCKEDSHDENQGTRGYGAWHKVMAIDGERMIDSKKDEDTKGDEVTCDPWGTHKVSSIAPNGGDFHGGW